VSSLDVIRNTCSRLLTSSRRILFLIGFVYRIVAYLLLVFLNRDKQR